MSETNVLGLTGKIGAGKDSVADFLIKNHNYVRVAFADAVRDAAYKLNPLIPVGELMGVVTHAPLQKVVDHNGWDYTKRHYVEARRILQVTGSEVGRDLLGKDVWIDIARPKVEAALHAGHNVVISDVRFQNECDYVHALGGEVWEVVRPDNNSEAVASTHQSEQGVESDGILLNDGDLNDLEAYVQRLALTPYTPGDVRDIKTTGQ